MGQASAEGPVVRVPLLVHLAPLLRFRIADEHLEIILTMDEVNLEGTPVRNFRVHAFYKPEIHGLNVDLVRDGALGVEGRIRTGDRARMHGVFNKVLAEDEMMAFVRNGNLELAGGTPEDFAERIKRDTEMYARIAKDAKIEPQ